MVGVAVVAVGVEGRWSWVDVDVVEGASDLLPGWKQNYRKDGTEKDVREPAASKRKQQLAVLCAGRQPLVVGQDGRSTLVLAVQENVSKVSRLSLCFPLQTCFCSRTTIAWKRQRRH